MSMEDMAKELYQDYKTSKLVNGKNYKYTKALKRAVKYYTTKSSRKELGYVF